MIRLKKLGITALTAIMLSSTAFMPVFAEPLGDGGVSSDIIASSTAPSAVNTASVAVQADVPAKFGLTIVLVLMNKDTKEKIQYNLYSDNRYYDVGYLAPGTYEVLSCRVSEDISNLYPFEAIQPFTVGQNETKMLTPTLKDRTAVEKAIQEAPVLTKTDAEDTAEKAKKVEDYVSPYADYEGLEIEHTGTGKGFLLISGKQNGLYDIVIKVTETGTMGGMKIIYSMDGGATWSEETTVPLNGDVNLQVNTSKGLKDSGLIATFDASPDDERPFIKDDTYTTYAPDPSTDLIIKSDGESTNKIVVRPVDRSKHAFDIIFDNGYDIQIRFTKLGSFGTAVYTATVDGKNWADEEYLPIDGIIPISEDLTVDLSQLRNFTFGQTITISAVRHNNTRIIIVAVVLVTTVIAGFFYFIHKMKSRMPGRGAYEVLPYESIEKKAG